MRNISLENGKNVIVNENDLSDIVSIIKEECSAELAEMLNAMISYKLSVLEYERQALSQEMMSYESDLEDAERALRDIEEDADDLLIYIAGSKRIDRKHLIEVLREIRLLTKENL